jgi:hypothetical protein
MSNPYRFRFIQNIQSYQEPPVEEPPVEETPVEETPVEEP